MPLEAVKYFSFIELMAKISFAPVLEKMDTMDKAMIPKTTRNTKIMGIAKPLLRPIAG
jgi:hypothetical protein